MECGNCTLCCKLLEVSWYGSPAGKYCKHCEIDVGCKIHKIKNVECTSFNCAWVQQKKAAKALRPDKCGVVFERITDNIMLGTRERKGIIRKVVTEQIMQFNKQGFSTIINSLDGHTEVFMVKGMDKEQIMDEIKEKWQHRVIPQI